MRFRSRLSTGPQKHYPWDVTAFSRSERASAGYLSLEDMRRIDAALRIVLDL